MGWAKYMEDNLDYFEEREDARQRYQQIYSPDRDSDIWMPDNYLYTSPEKTVERECKPMETLFFSFLLEKNIDQKGNLICRDCGRVIPFPEEKRVAYAQKGWNPPKRCRNCKSLRETRFLMRRAY